MSRVFVDTAFYIAFMNPRDKWHSAAVALAERFQGHMITSEFVLVELGNHLCAAKDRGLFIRFLETLRRDSRTSILPASSEYLEKGLLLYRQRQDKDWSLTDCISLASMRELALTDVMTTDQHFSQAGYNVLLHQ